MQKQDKQPTNVAITNAYGSIPMLFAYAIPIGAIINTVALFDKNCVKKAVTSKRTAIITIGF